jgi:hypothetical protein
LFLDNYIVAISKKHCDYEALNEMQKYICMMQEIKSLDMGLDGVCKRVMKYLEIEPNMRPRLLQSASQNLLLVYTVAYLYCKNKDIPFSLPIDCESINPLNEEFYKTDDMVTVNEKMGMRKLVLDHLNIVIQTLDHIPHIYYYFDQMIMDVNFPGSNMFNNDSLRDYKGLRPSDCKNSQNFSKRFSITKYRNFDQLRKDILINYRQNKIRFVYCLKNVIQEMYFKENSEFLDLIKTFDEFMENLLTNTRFDLIETLTNFYKILHKLVIFWGDILNVLSC